MDKIVLELKSVGAAYGEKQVVKNVSMKFPKNQISALTGASGLGKSTLLRLVSRMNDDIATVTGKIMFGDVSINDPKIDTYRFRWQAGMVFQRPTPFPTPIYDSVVYGLRLAGEKRKDILGQRVEESLRQAALWDEVKDSLNSNGNSLSNGQQQRLCIAKTLVARPEVTLVDEPISALDPISTSQIEQTMPELGKDYAIITVTYNMQQVSRSPDWTVFMHQGELVELNKASEIFINPQKQQTGDYLSGKFG